MIRCDGPYFLDESGRSVMLRGVNVGGSSKTPTRPEGATHLIKEFYHPKNLSFVGNPFPLSDADEHFARLRTYGFNTLRLLTTWEAVEHAAPGEYDEEYLDYLHALAAKAGEYGFYLIIDFHQDCWSRWSGGDGAPAWTLEAAGFAVDRLHEAAATFLHQESDAPYPRMRWVTNYNKLAAATMFTLFFGGNDFAVKSRVGELPIQEFLQERYLLALQKIAMRLSGMPHLLGYDIMNEPSSGWIGRKDLNCIQTLFSEGESPTPFQSMLLGEGLPQTVALTKMGLRGVVKVGSRRLNEKGVRAWKEGGAGVWRENDLYTLGEGGARLLRPDHFSKVEGRAVDFCRDYYRPFIERAAAMLRSLDEGLLLFVEEPIDAKMAELKIPNLVNASHWYDALLLIKKRVYRHLAFNPQKRTPLFFSPVIGRSFVKQLGAIKRMGSLLVKGPTLIGEFGIPFDLDDKIGYRKRDFSLHNYALNRSFRAIEENCLSATLWNYTADNSHKRGDRWNGEDFSIFSRDDSAPFSDKGAPFSGARAAAAFCRPYPMKSAGEPLHLAFDPDSARFSYTFRHRPGVEEATELFVPSYHYSNGPAVEVSDGSFSYDKEKQMLYYKHSSSYEKHTIRLERKKKKLLLTDDTLCEEGSPPVALQKKNLLVNGLSYHVVEAGDREGEPLLFLHGFPEFWLGWRRQIPYFAERGYRLILPDMRGYNLTDKPKGVEAYRTRELVADVVALLDALEIERAKLVGHDWGGVIAWWAAANHPDRFEKVALLNAPHPASYLSFVKKNVRQMMKSWYVALFQLKWLPEKLLSINDFSLLEKLLFRSGRDDTFTKKEMELYKEAWRVEGSTRAMINWYRAAMRFGNEGLKKHVEIPLLLLFGAKDSALSRDLAELSVDRYASSGSVQLFEEATHWLQHDEASRVNSAIEAFFSSGSEKT